MRAKSSIYERHDRIDVLQHQRRHDEIETQRPDLVPVVGQQIGGHRRQRTAPLDHRRQVEARDMPGDRLEIREAPADPTPEVEHAIEVRRQLDGRSVRGERLSALEARQDVLAQVVRFGGVGDGKPMLDPDHLEAFYRDTNGPWSRVPNRCHVRRRLRESATATVTLHGLTASHKEHQGHKEHQEAHEGRSHVSR